VSFAAARRTVRGAGRVIRLEIIYLYSWERNITHMLPSSTTGSFSINCIESLSAVSTELVAEKQIFLMTVFILE